jgi:hypothetical protein
VVRGLRRYRAGLVLTVAATVAGYALVLAATAVFRSMTGIRVITTGMCAVCGPAAVLMALGLAGLMALDRATGARRTAVAGFALQIPAALAELGLLGLYLANLSRSYFASHRVLVQSGWLTAASQVLGLASAVCVALTLSRLGRHLGDPRLGERARTVLVSLSVLLVLVAAFRLLLVASVRVPGWPMPMLAVGTLSLSGVALFMYLRLIGAALDVVTTRD